LTLSPKNAFASFDSLTTLESQGWNMRVPTSTASGRAAVFSALGVLAAWSLLLVTATPPRSRQASTSLSSTAAVSTTKRSDQELRDQLVGTWHRAFLGEQRIRIEPDGRATLVVQPNLIWSFLFGRRLVVQITWKLENGHVIYHILGGTPEKKVQLARDMFGEYWDQTILKLTETQLVLFNNEGYGDDVWLRDEISTH